MDSKKTTLYLVRHAQSEGNVHGILQGHSDSPIVQLGVQQAQALAYKFKDIQIDAIYSSDLQRAYKTALILALGRDIKIETSNKLRERDFGKFQGVLDDKTRVEWLDFKKKLANLPYQERLKVKAAPSVESDEELLNRSLIFLKQLVKTHINQTILIVTHGGVMGLFLRHIGFAPWNQEISIQNTGWAKVISDGENFKVEETSGIEFI